MLVAPKYDRSIKWRASALLLLVGLMWLVFGFNALLPDGVFHAQGIVPRTSDGFTAIIVAPLFHLSLDHLVGNTLPLLVLGSVILLGGLNEFLVVTMVCILISGGGTWLLGTPHTSHIGASGLVFGYFGFLLSRSIFDRRVIHFAVTILVAVLYGGSMAMSLIPQQGISWSGHVFGFVGGVAAARFIAARRRRVAAYSGSGALYEVRRSTDEDFH